MFIKYLTTIAVLLVALVNVKGQSPSWLKNVNIRQSFEDDESKQKPALLTATYPNDKSASYLVDLGLKYNISRKALQSQSSIIGEYHRNTLSDGEVNNLQFGFKYIRVLKKPALPENIFDILNPNFIQTYKTFKLNATSKYRYDKIEGSHGLAASALFSYFQQGPKSSVKTRWSSWNSNRDSNLAYLLVPEFGVELQENFKADSTKYNGFVGRTVLGMAISFGSIFKNPDNAFVPLNRWLFSINANLRYDVVGKQYTSSRWHPLIKTSVDFFLLYKPIKLTFGPSFTYGDNPIEGFREFNFKKQQFWVLAVKVQK